MTFQSHTTYEQSVRLRELGLEQPEDRSTSQFYETRHDGWHFYGPSEQRHCSVSYTGNRVRALTRQEIEDILMKQYGLVTIGVAWETDTEPATVSVRLFIPNNADRFFTSESSDPFTSLYDALIWHLERQRKAPTTTPV